MARREMTAGLLAFATIATAGCTASGRPSPARAPSVPRAWRIERGAATITLLGLGDARDMSWFTPPLRQAFDASGELWLETAPQDKTTPADLLRARSYMNLAEGTLFDAIEPHLVPRLKARLAELEVPESRVATLRPWWAYYQVNGTWWGKHPVDYTAMPADAALDRLAAEAGKPVSYEFANFAELAGFMAAMPPTAQSQYLEWLLDTQDARAAGESDPFGWIEGRQPEASLARMRRLPELYGEMQVKRNGWWAAKIAELLAAGRSAFVAVGQLHVMGPAGIPAQLAGLGIAAVPA